MDGVKAMTHQDSPLGSAPVGKLVLQLAIPAMLAQFVNILYSVVDRMYVGHIANAGDAALAGVGVCAPVVTMITALGVLIGFGGGPLMSIRMGRRDMDGARQIVANSFYLLLALSVMATVPLLVFRRQILFTFGCSEALWEYAEAYFTTYVSGTVFAVMSYGLNQITMSQGFASTAMRSVMLGAAVNIALDPVFIFVLNMGVRGAALATVLSQICSTAYILRFLLGGKAAVGITRQPVNPGWMRRIVQVGLSPALIIALDNVLLISVNIMLRRYGGADSDMLIACAAVMQSFMLIITMPLGGITAGTQSILGYNYGAGNTKRIAQAFRGIILLCVVFCGSDVRSRADGFRLFCTDFHQRPGVYRYGVVHDTHVFARRARSRDTVPGGGRHDRHGADPLGSDVLHAAQGAVPRVRICPAAAVRRDSRHVLRADFRHHRRGRVRLRPCLCPAEAAAQAAGLRATAGCLPAGLVCDKVLSRR